MLSNARRDANLKSGGSTDDAQTPARPCRCNQPLRDRDSCLYCGRSVTPEPEPVRQIVRTPGNPWTRAGVVRAFKAFEFFRGRAPSPTDWSQRMAPDWPPLPVVEHLFGSLADAVGAAGLGPSMVGARDVARASAAGE